MVRKGFRVGMEPSTASEEEKGSEQAKGRDRERGRKELQSNKKDIRMKTWRRLDRAESLTRTHKDGGTFALPPHGVDSEGPGCMDGWKVLFKSKGSLSIFKVLRIKAKKKKQFAFNYAFKSKFILVELNCIRLRIA